LDTTRTRPPAVAPRPWFASLTVGLCIALAAAPIVVGVDGALASDGCTPAAEYAGGAGTAGDKYQIQTAAHLKKLEATPGDWGKEFVQTGEINMSACGWIRIGRNTGNALEKFTGTFDGSNHKIIGLTSSASVANVDGVGMFGITDGATIQRVHLENVAIVAGFSAIGGLVGRSENTTISNVTVTGTVTANQGTGDNEWDVGGLVGHLLGGSVKESSMTGTVSGTRRNVGGLVGKNVGGTIEDSEASSAVTGENRYVGGLVGFNSGTIKNSHTFGADTVTGKEGTGGLSGYNHPDGVISDSSAAVKTTITDPDEDRLGGLVGDNRGIIERSSASGAVEGADDDVGGLVGYNRGVIRHSFATSKVTAADERVGGLVGTNRPDGQVEAVGTIIDSYSTGSVTGRQRVGGLVGLHRGAIVNSFSTGAVTGLSAAGGLVGALNTDPSTTNSFWDVDTSTLETSAQGTGKPNADMLSISTYTTDLGAGSWALVAAQSFSAPGFTSSPQGPQDQGDDEIWGIGSDVNCGYPFLWWQTSSAFDECPVVVTSTNGSDLPGSSSSSSSPDASATPGIHLDVQASVGTTTVAGSSVVIGGQELQPGSAYSLVVRSNPITITSGVASSTGSFSTRVSMPSGIAPGNHTITLQATGSDGSALVLTQSFTVAADGTFSALGAVSGQTAGGLAATGPNSAGLLGGLSLAALMLLAGAGLIIRRKQLTSNR